MLPWPAAMLFPRPSETCPVTVFVSGSMRLTVPSVPNRPHGALADCDVGDGLRCSDGGDWDVVAGVDPP